MEKGGLQVSFVNNSAKIQRPEFTTQSGGGLKEHYTTARIKWNSDQECKNGSVLGSVVTRAQARGQWLVLGRSPLLPMDWVSSVAIQK